jgi:hypothetical protein
LSFNNVVAFAVNKLISEASIKPSFFPASSTSNAAAFNAAF